MQTLIKSDEIDLSKFIEIRKPVIKINITSKVKSVNYRQIHKKFKLSEEVYRRERIKANCIIDLICNFYNINKLQLTNCNKIHNVLIVKAKHQAMYLIYEFTELGEPTIGSIFNRNHSSVNSAKKRVDKDMTYPKYKAEFDNLREQAREAIKKININAKSFNFLLSLKNDNSQSNSKRNKVSKLYQ
jgi:hypothetical protein